MKPSDVILVVDDDTELRKALCASLEQEGHVAVAASDGRDALRWLASGAIRPRLIVLDLQMPEIDGEAFRARIAHDPRHCSTPVLLTSAREDVREVAARLGVQAVLVKPFHADTFLDLVEVLLSGEPLPSSSTPVP